MSFTGIEMRQKNQLYPVLIGTTHVTELSTMNQDEGGLHVGASVTLSALNDKLLQLIKDLPGELSNHSNQINILASK